MLPSPFLRPNHTQICAETGEQVSTTDVISADSGQARPSGRRDPHGTVQGQEAKVSLSLVGSAEG